MMAEVRRSEIRLLLIRAVCDVTSYELRVFAPVNLTIMVGHHYLGLLGVGDGVSDLT